MFKRKIFYPRQNAALEDLEGIITAQSDNFKEFLLKWEPYTEKVVLTSTYTDIISEVPELKPSSPIVSALTIVVSGGLAYLNQDMLELPETSSFSLPDNNIQSPTGLGQYTITRRDVLGIRLKGISGDILLKDFVDELGNIQKRPVPTTVTYASELVYTQGVRNPSGGVRPIVDPDIFPLVEINLRDNTTSIYDTDQSALNTGYLVDLRDGYVINPNAKNLPSILGREGKFLTIYQNAMYWGDSFKIPWTAEDTFHFMENVQFDKDLGINDWSVTTTIESSGSSTVLNIQKEGEDKSASFETNGNHKTFVLNSGLVCKKVTTAQRNLITNPPIGFIIYNTEKYVLESWNGLNWIGVADQAPDYYQFNAKYPYTEEDSNKAYVASNGSLTEIMSFLEFMPENQIIDNMSSAARWATLPQYNSTNARVLTDVYNTRDGDGALAFDKMPGNAYCFIENSTALSPFVNLSDNRLLFYIKLPSVTDIKVLVRIKNSTNPAVASWEMRYTYQGDGKPLKVGWNLIVCNPVLDIESLPTADIAKIGSINLEQIDFIDLGIYCTTPASIVASDSPIVIDHLAYMHDKVVLNNMTSGTGWTAPGGDESADFSLNNLSGLGDAPLVKVPSWSISMTKGSINSSYALLNYVIPGAPRVLTNKMVGMWFNFKEVGGLDGVCLHVASDGGDANNARYVIRTDYLGRSFTTPGWYYCKFDMSATPILTAGACNLGSIVLLRVGVKTLANDVVYPTASKWTVDNISIYSDPAIEMVVGTERRQVLLTADQKFAFDYLTPYPQYKTLTAPVSQGEMLAVNLRKGNGSDNWGQNLFYQMKIVKQII